MNLLRLLHFFLLLLPSPFNTYPRCCCTTSFTVFWLSTSVRLTVLAFDWGAGLAHWLRGFVKVWLISGSVDRPERSLSGWGVVKIQELTDSLLSLFLLYVPAGSASRGRDVAVYVFDVTQPSLPAPIFLFCSRVCFCLCGPFNCISFHKFSGQLSAFSLCYSGLISALLGLSTIYISLWKSPSVLI